MISHFQAHGQFSFTVDRGLLTTEVQGPWNAEFVKLWMQETRPIVEELATQGKLGVFGYRQGFFIINA